MSTDITQAIVSGNYLDLYWAMKRHPPDQVREALAALDAVTLTRFITRLVNEWYRLQVALDAANEELDIEG